jgi:hypothetical protein
LVAEIFFSSTFFSCLWKKRSLAFFSGTEAWDWSYHHNLRLFLICEYPW